ncbi:hypothetical protein C8J56DRAFT_825998 [Mycena floridula]|nr:hypothetical protein C8J56DRAFT_825998 [Mycena floridula]
MKRAHFCSSLVFWVLVAQSQSVQRSRLYWLSDQHLVREIPSKTSGRLSRGCKTSCLSWQAILGQSPSAKALWRHCLQLTLQNPVNRLDGRQPSSIPPRIQEETAGKFPKNLRQMADNCKFCGFSSATADPPTGPAIQQLLSSNNAPSELQESQVHDAIAEIIDSIRDIDAQIVALQHKRARKSAELQECKSVLHPIRRIPKEILSEIFVLLLDEDFEGDSLDDEEDKDEADEEDGKVQKIEKVEVPSSLDPLAPHWVISRVCGEWRAVALSFPRLWSTVRIVDKDLENDGVALEIEMLQIQLHRSAVHDLSVSIHYTSSEDPPVNHPLLQKLLATSLRWTDLHIVTNRLTAFDAFTSLKGFLPILKILHIWDYNASPADPISSIFELAPNLKTLWGHSNAMAHFHLPFSQITTFESTLSCPCNSYPEILAQMPNLLTLSTLCRDPVGHIGGYHLPVSVSLPRLQRATLQLDHSKGPHRARECFLLSRLRLPALQNLDIQVHSSMDELRDLFDRSGCPLKNLRLEPAYVRRTPCVDLLLGIPTLESLTLDCHYSVVERVLEEVTDNPSIVPDLQRLKVDIDWQWDSEKIEELIESRPALVDLTMGEVKFEL